MPSRLEALENLRLGVGDRLFGTEVFDVCGSNRGDKRNVRTNLRVSAAISPLLFIPISRTANSASRGMRARLSGTPVWLL